MHHPDNPHGPSYSPPQTLRASRALSISYSPIRQTYSTANAQERQARVTPDPLLLSWSFTGTSSGLEHDAALKDCVDRLSVMVTQLKDRPHLKLTSSERVVNNGNSLMHRNFSRGWGSTEIAAL